VSNDRERSRRPDVSTEAGPTFPGRIIAALLEVTERRLQQLVVEGWIQRAERGEYSLRDSVRGYLRSLKHANRKRTRTPASAVGRDARAAAAAALAVLAGVDARCVGVDGRAPSARDEITDAELRALWRHVKRVQQLLELAK
jgi:hypothetical protein